MMTERLTRLFLVGLMVVWVLWGLRASTASATHLVISEIQLTGGTGATTDEFVELYNPTDAAVSLAGWKLTKKTAAGSEYPLVENFGEKSVPGHGFFLIAHPTGYSGNVLPDVRYSTTNSLANDNTVVLVDTSGNAVDRVGFGSATDKEGTTLSNPGSKKSVERKARPTSTAETMAEGGSDAYSGNGEDTDDNSQDFVSRDTPEPQNSLGEPETLSVQTSNPTVPPPATSPTPTPTTKQTPVPATAPKPAENHPPIAVIVPLEDDEWRVRDVLTFSSKGSSDPDGDRLKFSWSFGDGTKANGATSSHAFQKAGKYAIVLTVEDGKGGKADAETNIVVSNYDVNRKIVINELLPNPEGDDTEEWIELTNSDSRSVDLAGWALLVGDNRFRLDGMTLAKGAYALVSREQSRIALPNTEGKLTLVDPNGKVMQAVEYMKAASGVSFSRTPDGTWHWTDRPTPGAGNTFVDFSTAATTVERVVEDPKPAETPGTVPTAEASAGKVEGASTNTASPETGQAAKESKPAIEISPDRSTDRVRTLLFIGLGVAAVGVLGFTIRRYVSRRTLKENDEVIDD